MNQKDIIVGQEYTYSRGRTVVFPQKATVLAKGLDYNNAKGRGIEIETKCEGRRLVLAGRLHGTWAEWEERQAQEKTEQALADAAAERRKVLADRFCVVLKGLGITSRTKAMGVSVLIMLDERAAIELLGLLDAQNKIERYKALGELTEQAQRLGMGYEG